ncbi:MAG: M48 family metallopeptidase [Deltaproteobacteria bacterium]|nr:M48 family metallopeptidase [Deltaproteobacteria bacterium]
MQGCARGTPRRTTEWDDGLPVVPGALLSEPTRRVPRHIELARGLARQGPAVVAPPVHGAYVMLALILAPLALSAPLLFVGIIGALGAVGVAVCVLAFDPGIPVRLRVAVLGVGVTLAAFALALVHAMFARLPRDRGEGTSVVVTRQSEPALFALIDRCASALGTRAPDEVRLDADINASARFDGRRTTMTLGLPLILSLSVRELACVIGHELRHFQQGTARKLSTVVTRTLLWPLIGSANLVETEPSGVITLILQLALRAVLFVVFRPLLWLGMIACRAMGRAQEVDADRAGAALGGSDAMKSSLARLSRLAEAAERDGLDLDEMRATRAADARAVVGRWSRRPPQRDDEHPPPKARLGLIEKTGTPGVIEVDADAEELFAHLESYAGRILAGVRSRATVPGVVLARRLP